MVAEEIRGSYSRVSPVIRVRCRNLLPHRDLLLTCPLAVRCAIELPAPANRLTRATFRPQYHVGSRACCVVRDIHFNIQPPPPGSPFDFSNWTNVFAAAAHAGCIVNSRCRHRFRHLPDSSCPLRLGSYALKQVPAVRLKGRVLW